MEKTWWWAQSIPLRRELAYALPALLALAFSLVSAPPRASPLPHYYHATPLPPVLSLLFRWASEFFSGFGLGVLLRGRLGGANGCPSLRLG